MAAEAEAEAPLGQKTVRMAVTRYSPRAAATETWKAALAAIATATRNVVSLVLFVSRAAAVVVPDGSFFGAAMGKLWTTYRLGPMRTHPQFSGIKSRDTLSLRHFCPCDAHLFFVLVLRSVR